MERNAKLPRKRKKWKDDDIDFELSIYEGIVREDPNHVEALTLLGNLYTKKGKYEKGLEVDHRLLELKPEDPVVHYNLACSLSLLKRADGALDALERSVDLGYRDLEWMMKDEDLENIRSTERFIKLVGRVLS